MKYLDFRHRWLREELETGNLKRVDRRLNASDMLTHSSSAEELRKFLPMIGCHTMTANRKLQRNHDDAERDACSNSDCISDESGGCGEVVIAVDLACASGRVCTVLLSLESACKSSSHSSYPALDWIFGT